MTPRERVLKCLARERPERVPYEFSLTPKPMEEFRRRTGADSPVTHYDFDMRGVGIGPTRQRTDFSEYLPRELPEGTGVDEWGVARVPGSVYHFTKMVHPLSSMDSVEELEEYPFPDLDAEYRLSHFEDRACELHSQGYFVDGTVGHIYETAWYMRGMENLLVDFHQNPEFAHHLLDRITDFNVTIARRMAEADFDMVRFGDDVGTQKSLMMAPDTWREFLKPRLAREIRAARSVKPEIHVWYHSDGDVSDILEDLFEVGVDVLNPVQPECMDPLEVKRRYGERVSLWGTIGTQTLMPFGSPDEVRETVRRNITNLGYNGGLVLAPTHVLEPDVPWENVEAFVEACRESS